MTSTTSVHDQYLTHHLSHLVTAETFKRKKIWLCHNHKASLPDNRDAHILDIGPGIGILLDLLANDLGYLNVKAIDISTEVVDACNHVVPGSTEHVTDSISYLDQRLDTYDCVFLLHVLEHIAKYEVLPFLRAIHGALKPGGRLIVEVPNMANPITGLNMRYTDFTHEVGFTDLSLTTVLQAAGYTQIKVFGCRIPFHSPLRVAQSIAQSSLELLFRTILAAYMPTRPSIMTYILGACATRPTNKQAETIRLDVQPDLVA